MKTTKTTTTAFEIGTSVIIGAMQNEYVVRFDNGDITSYTTEEMKECYGLTATQLRNIQYVLRGFI